MFGFFSNSISSTGSHDTHENNDFWKMIAVFAICTTIGISILCFLFVVKKWEEAKAKSRSAGEAAALPANYERLEEGNASSVAVRKR